MARNRRAMRTDLASFGCRLGQTGVKVRVEEELDVAIGCGEREVAAGSQADEAVESGPDQAGDLEGVAPVS